MKQIFDCLLSAAFLSLIFGMGTLIWLTVIHVIKELFTKN